MSAATVSPAVAALLHKLQGQIIKEASAPRLPEPGEVVLPAAAYTSHEYHDRHTHRVVTSRNDRGDEVRLQTPHLPYPAHEWSKPGIWYGLESRRDTAGRDWTCSLPCNYVMDDFGSLVEAPK